MKPLKKFFSGTVFFGHVKCDKYLNIEPLNLITNVLSLILEIDFGLLFSSFSSDWRVVKK